MHILQLFLIGNNYDAVPKKKWENCASNLIIYKNKCNQVFILGFFQIEKKMAFDKCFDL